MLIRNLIALTGAALVSVTAVAEDRDVFKWVTTDGQVIYSDRPQDDDAQRLSLTSKATDNARITAAKQARIEAAQTARLKELENVQVAESESEEKARYTENCKRAQKALASLLEASRLYLPTEDGGRRFLTEDEKALRVAKARADVKDWCK